MQHSYGAIGTPIVGHHQWRLLPQRPRRPLAVGSGKFNRTARLMLYEMRWRKPPPQRGLRVVAGVSAVLLHVLAVFAILLEGPPSWPPPAPAAADNSIQVRLIEQPKPPPPPPPPIKLRHLPRHKAPAVRTPLAVKNAPVAAMPPIRTSPLPLPQVTLAPAKPQVSTPQGAPQPPQRVAASVPAPTQPAPPVPPPPKVVLEPSTMALPPPPLPQVQVQPVTAPSTRLQPVPTNAPQPIAIGAPQLKLSVAQPLPASAQPVEHPQAVPPTPLAAVPVPSAAPPRVTLQPTPTPAPSVEAPQPTPPAVQRPQVEAAPLAPIPQAPSPSIAPDLHLPVANVPVPQAPQVQAPAVRAPAPEAVAAAPAPTAATSAANAAKPSATKSWVTSSDQFKPVPRPGHGQRARKPGQGKGNASSGHGNKPGSYVQLYPRGNSDVMSRNSNQLGYKPTIFNQYWAPENESVLDALLRHFIEKFTVKHTFELAPGVRVHCALGPMMIFFACGGDPPAAMSAKSNDPRLNMAPANPLVPGMGAPAAASTAPVHINNDVKCEVARVAGGPPPPGCPGAPVPPSKSDQWH